MTDRWVALAACKQVADKGIFFPEPSDHGQAAKAVCAMCPVTRECLAWALEHHQEHGIWGGLTTRERRLMMSHELEWHECVECGAEFGWMRAHDHKPPKTCGESCSRERRSRLMLGNQNQSRQRQEA